MHELTKILEIKLEHATLKHPQTVGVVERSHSALKRILKLNTHEQWNDWYKYVQLAAFFHNTSYHFAIGCSPTVLFHGREPFKPLGLRFNNTALARHQPTSEYVIALQDAMLQQFAETKDKLIVMYNKYRSYYDFKAEAQPLKQHSFCLLLNPKLTTQSEFTSKFLPIWLPLYRVEKVLTNCNYIIRKINTNYTKCVHRIRLRPIVPQYSIEDLSDINWENFRRDPMLGRFRSEPALFDESVPTLLMPQENNVALPPPSTTDSPPVSVTLSFPVAPAVAPPRPVLGPVIPPLPTAAVATALPHKPDPSAVALPDVHDQNPIVAHDANDIPAGSSESAEPSTPSPVAASSDTQSRSTTKSRDPNANIL